MPDTRSTISTEKLDKPGSPGAPESRFHEAVVESQSKEKKAMSYRVTYVAGETVREAVMSQRELDVCRSRCEIVEAVAVADACPAPNTQTE